MIAPTPFPGPDVPGNRILIVEDDKPLAAILRVPFIAKPFTLERLSAVCAPYLRPPVGLSA